MIKPDKFIALNRPWLQSHATAGREPLNLYRDPTGRARLLLVGWPAPKSWFKVASATPAPVTPRSRASTATPSTPTQPESETST